jgi:molybdopterin converting factor small subunit
MATKTKNTPATVTTTGLELTPENVTSTIDSLKAQLSKLKSNVPEAVSTNIDYNGTNIKDVTKVSELLEISSSIHARNAAYGVEAQRYAVEGKVKAFTVNEKSVIQWKEIIEKAIFELVNKKQIDQIEAAIKRLSKFEDEKTQLQREFDGIVGSASELLA